MSTMLVTAAILLLSISSINADGNEGFKPSKDSYFPSLDLVGSNVRLCSGSATSPFIVGDFLAHDSVGRLTVFDAEILHNMQSLKSEKKKTEDTNGVSFVNFLAFMESAGSIDYALHHSWGPGVLADLAKKINLTCKYFPGHDPSARAEEPLWEGEAAIAIYTDYFMNIHCPLPTDSAQKAAFFKSSKFQIQLLLSEESKDQILHMDSLPLCRDDGLAAADTREDFSISRSALTQVTEDAQQLTVRRASRKLAALHRQRPSAEKKEAPSAAAQRSSNETEDSLVVKAKSATSVAICVRAYHDHNLFDSKRTTHSDARLLEFLDYHLLMGVKRIYFYDRYGAEMLPLLQPYIDRGLVVHVPFPEWSEVYYRKEWFKGKALYPYTFPMIYDQVLNYEACLMAGRRNNDDWMAFIDTDEFLWTPTRSIGSAPAVIDAMVAKRRASEEKAPVAAISVHRVNFFGANSGGEPFLQSCTERCEGHLVDPIDHGKFIEYRSKAKLFASPREMLGGVVAVHIVEGIPKNQIVQADIEDFRFNHYKTVTAEQLYGTEADFCADKNDPSKKSSHTIEDKSLEWVVEVMQACTAASACERFTSGQCGSLCP